MTFKKIFSLILIAAATFSIGCSDDKTTTPPAATPQAKLLVVHASPNAPGVDLLIDNAIINTAALTYLNNTGYLSANAGTRNVKVNVTGTSTTVIAADLALAENKNYSVFAIDSVSKITPIVTEDNLAAPASGNAHIRFIHLSPNAPAVDVSVVGQAVGVGLFLNRSFNKSITASQSAFTPVLAGTYNLEVRVANTTTVALAVGNVTLTAGKIYTIYARGFLTGTGSSALGATIIANN